MSGSLKVPTGNVLDRHIAEREFLHTIKLRLHFSSAADAEDESGGDRFEPDRRNQSLADNGLRSARIYREIVWTLAVDLQAGENQVEGFPELDWSGILRRLHDRDIFGAERMQHLQSGLRFD